MLLSLTNGNDIDLSRFLADELLKAFKDIELMDRYDVYQALLSYWVDIMADDTQLVARDGWYVARELDIEHKTRTKTENGEKVSYETGQVKTFDGVILPSTLVESELFPEESMACELCSALIAKDEGELNGLIEEAAEDSELFDLAQAENVNVTNVTARIDGLLAKADSPAIQELTALQEWFSAAKRKKAEYTRYVADHPLCRIAVNDKGNVTETSIVDALRNARIEKGPSDDYADDYAEMLEVQRLLNEIGEAKSQLKQLRQALDERIMARYETLTEDEIQRLLIDEKWFFGVYDGLEVKHAGLGAAFVARLQELVSRYELTLPLLTSRVEQLENRVTTMLVEMGFTW